MRLIDADKLLESMSKRYDEKKDIVPDNLAEGFMQVEKLIHEQDAIENKRYIVRSDGSIHNLDEDIEKARAEAIDELLNKVSESIIWDVLAEIMKRNIGASDGADKIIDYLQKVAEQLKEKNNENI